MFYTHRYKDGWIHASVFPGREEFRACIDTPKRETGKTGIIWEHKEKTFDTYRKAQLWITRNL